MLRMPVVFIGHGSPMNALEKNPFTEGLSTLGRSLPKPRAILAVSAHWETVGTRVIGSEEPITIHDFFGFPQPLFDIVYPAKGSPSLVREISSLIDGVQVDPDWGFDHGAWSVLVHMFPKADVPVVQLSLDTEKTAEEHLELGRLLRPLRDQGILILGSGNIVHNLRMLQWKSQGQALPWAQEFDSRIKDALEQRQESVLTSYESIGESAQLSVPSKEHYLPLLYTYGASDAADVISYPYEGFDMGALSMRSVMWG